MFNTVHGEALTRILHAYAAGPGLITALEAYIVGAIDRERSRLMDEIAQTVCEGLHDGMPGGLKCGRCYTAESTAMPAAVISLEMDETRRAKEGS